MSRDLERQKQVLEGHLVFQVDFLENGGFNDEIYNWKLSEVVYGLPNFKTANVNLKSKQFRISA